MADVANIKINGTTYNVKDSVARNAAGGPNVAATKAAMTDKSKVYVYTGSESGMTKGNWYYWNGSAWTSGGVYQSTGFTTDTTLTVSGMAADAKVTGDNIIDVKNALSYSINPAIHEKRDGSRNRFLSLQGTKALKNKIINSRGGLEDGTGTGNNWVSGLVKIPSDKQDITVSSPSNIKWCAAFYDETFGFLSFFDNKSVPTFDGIEKNIQIVDNAEYIRFGLYSSSGYSDDKFYKLFRAYTILENQHYPDNDELAPYCPWGMTMPDSNRNIIYAASAVGFSEYIKFDKPVIVTPTDQCQLAIVAKDPDVNGNTVSQWFPSEPTPIFVPAGVNVWIGIRFLDSSKTIYLTENICEFVSIKYADDIVCPTTGNRNVLNGYCLFGHLEIIGLSYSSFQKAKEDMLVHLLDARGRYTLSLYAGNEIDYSDAKNWTIYYSRKSDFVIPAGTWYQLTVFGHDNYTIDDVLTNFYEIIPLKRNFYSPMYNSFTTSLIATIGGLAKRVAQLENYHVPAYFEDHLNEKINIINSLFPNVADQFVFITDVHLNGYGGNPGHAKSLINRIANNTAITKVINGGDLLNRPSLLLNDAKTKRDTLSLIEDAASYSRPDNGIPQYLIVGNHDSGVDYPNGERVTNTINVDEYMTYSGFNLIKPLVISDPKSDTQYYFDYNGIRYIIMNNELCDEIPTNESYTDTWRFLAAALISIPNDGHAIIMPHLLMNHPGSYAGKFSEEVINLADAYNNRGTGNFGSAYANFANCSGRVACFIAGHTHMDFSFTSNGGIPIILTTTDNGRAENSRSSLVRTVGTISEQAFDVFSIDKANRKIYATRIGAGYDREFAY